MFELCRGLGYAHPNRLLDALTAEELFEWWICYQAEPWGELRADFRQAAGILAGSDEGVELLWPYFGTDLDPDELISTFNELLELDRQAMGRVSDGNRG